MKTERTKTSVYKYLKPYWKIALLAPLFMVGEVYIDLLQPDYMAMILTEGVAKGDVNTIFSLGLKMLGLIVLGATCGILCTVFSSVTAQKFANDLRIATFDKVMKLSLQQTDQFSTGSLVTRITNDINTVQDYVAMLLRMFVRAPMFFVGGLIMTLAIDIRYGLVLAVALPLQLVVVILIIKNANPLFLAVQKKIDRVNSVVQENVSGARVIKAYVREDYEVDRFGNANDDLKNINYKVLKLISLISPILMIVMNASIIAVFAINGNAQSVEASAKVMKAITYITQILMSFMMVGMMFQMISRASACAGRVREVLSTDPAVRDGNILSSSDKGTVEFHNVSFRYPGTAGEPVLNNVSFNVKKGEFVAIVGATGSGKSSLVGLIPRFYDTDSGEVLIDGLNVKDYPLETLRNKIGFVLQKSELFAGTIAENIRWGNSEASDEEVVKAAEIAQAHRFISDFPDGYNTAVTEKGTSLSGGQKQRVSIARAVVRHPEILILDDSTSALDLATESELLRDLHNKLTNTTLIMIAQRISSIKRADRIAVIENGRITAFAPHDELMKISDTYRKIYSSQVKGDYTNE